MKSKKIMLYLHSVTREVNMAVKSWEVSDEFWARVAPLIPKVKRDPKKSYQRRRGGGRKPMNPAGFLRQSYMFCAQAFSGKPCRKNMAVPAVCIVISENGNHSDFSVNSGRKDLLNMMKWKELHGHGKVLTEQ